jgi:hypothetical protein
LEDYEPAMRRGMELENEEMARIADNPETPTFENTIEAMEQSGELLGNVTEVFFNLISAETNDEMDELADKMSPILSDHANDIMFNPKLAQRVKEVYEGIEASGEELTTEQRQLLRDTYLGFQRSGAYLPEDKQQRFLLFSVRFKFDFIVLKTVWFEAEVVSCCRILLLMLETRCRYLINISVNHGEHRNTECHARESEQAASDQY